MRQDDRHDAVLLHVLKAVKQEGKVGGQLGRKAIVLEPHVLRRGPAEVAAIAEVM